MSEGTEPAAVYVDPSTLVPWEQNPRHNDRAVDKVAASIETFGFASPIVARTGDSCIVAGHTRWKAALKLGLKQVPVRFLDLTDEQAAALTIADNRLGDLAAWDEEKLADLLGELRDFDVSALDVLGFATEELDALFGEWSDPFADEDFDDDSDPTIVDDGKSKVVVTVAVTRGNDASAIIHAALVAGGFTEAEYKLRVI